MLCSANLAGLAYYAGLVSKRTFWDGRDASEGSGQRPHAVLIACCQAEASMLGLYIHTYKHMYMHTYLHYITLHYITFYITLLHTYMHTYRHIYYNMYWGSLSVGAGAPTTVSPEVSTNPFYSPSQLERLLLRAGPRHPHH